MVERMIIFDLSMVFGMLLLLVSVPKLLTDEPAYFAFGAGVCLVIIGLAVGFDNSVILRWISEWN